MNSPYNRQRSYNRDRPRQRYNPRDRHDPGDWLANLLADDIFQQVAPLLFVVAVPLFILFTNKYKGTLFHPFRLLAHLIIMVLQGLGAVLPWNWNTGSRERKVSEKKKAVVRTRVEQMAQTNGEAVGESY